MSEVIRECRGANYQGFEVVKPDGGTRGEWKFIRGNGTLTLRASELRFVRWVPKKEFTIPLTSVVSVEAGKSHNGKRSFGFPVVKVRFAGADGERVFGVLVGRSEEADAWVEAIRATASGA